RLAHRPLGARDRRARAAGHEPPAAQRAHGRSGRAARPRPEPSARRMTAAPEVEIVDAPALYVVGELVTAPFERLHVEVPRAWERLAASGVEGRRLAEASFTTEAGYVEVVGVLGEQPPEAVPAGQVPVVMPAGRYARLVHEGPVTAIADGFA